MRFSNGHEKIRINDISRNRRFRGIDGFATNLENRPNRKIDKFEISTNSEYQRIRDIDEFEKSTNSVNRQIQKIDEFEISTNSKNRRIL